MCCVHCLQGQLYTCPGGIAYIIYALFIWLTNMWLILKYFCAYVYSAVKYLFCYVFFAHNDAKYVLSIWVTDGRCLLKGTWVHSRFLVRYMLLFVLVFCSVLCFLILFVFVASVFGLSILVFPFGLHYWHTAIPVFQGGLRGHIQSTMSLDNT